MTVISHVSDPLPTGHSRASFSPEKLHSATPHHGFGYCSRQNASFTCSPLPGEQHSSLSPSRMCAECPLCDTGCINFSHISVPFPSPWQSEAVALSVFLGRETLSSSHLRQVLEPSFLETPVLPSTCCGCFHFRPLYPALHSRLPFFSLHLRLHLSFVSLAENQVFPSVISALRGVQVD